MKWDRLFGMAGALLIAGAVLGPSASAQMFGDRQRVECGNLAEGDIVDSSIEIVCGMTAAEFADNMRLALSPLEADKEELFRRLDDLVPESSELRVEAIARFFEILGEAPVESEKLADRFAEIAVRHKSLLERVRLLEASEPRVAELRDAAAAAIETAEYDRADVLLAEAEAIELEAMRQLREALDQRTLNAAAIRAQRGDVARTQLDYDQAAEHFRTAAARAGRAGRRAG